MTDSSTRGSGPPPGSGARSTPTLAPAPGLVPGSPTPGAEATRQIHRVAAPRHRCSATAGAGVSSLGTRRPRRPTIRPPGPAPPSMAPAWVLWWVWAPPTERFAQDSIVERKAALAARATPVPAAESTAAVLSPHPRPAAREGAPLQACSAFTRSAATSSAVCNSGGVFAGDAMSVNSARTSAIRICNAAATSRGECRPGLPPQRQPSTRSMRWRRRPPRYSGTRCGARGRPHAEVREIGRRRCFGDVHRTWDGQDGR
jgi:hypothetical protein